MRDRGRTTALFVFALLLLLGLVGSAAGASVRHSGTIVEIDAGSGALVIEEVGPWRVRNGTTEVIHRAIILTPSTHITGYVRVNAPGRFEGDFIEVPFEITDLSRGDFVTVECQHERGRLIALSVAMADLTEP